MAQIVKMQKGGQPTRRYSTMTRNGVAEIVTDDYINKLRQHGYAELGDNEDAKRMFDIALNEMMYHDSSVDAEGNVGGLTFGMDEKQFDRASKPRKTAFGRTMAATFKGNRNDAQRAAYAIASFKYQKPRTKQDWSGKLTLDYSTDENGNLVYVNSPNNEKVIRMLGNISGIANYDPNDEFVGYNGMSKQDYINYYNKYGDAEIARLQNAIQTGSLTDNDWKILNNFGIFDKSKIDDEERKKAAALLAQKDKEKLAEKYKKLGFDQSRVEGFITFDENGNLITTDAFNETFGRYNMFNDSFLTSEYNPHRKLDFLHGWTQYDGKLYKTSDLENEDSELYKLLHAPGAWYDLNKSERYDDANRMLRYNWDGSDLSYERYNPQKINSTFMHQFGDSFRYRSLTGMHDGLLDGQQLIKYYTGDNIDIYGLPHPDSFKYAILDSNGDIIQDNVDINNLPALRSAEQQALQLPEVIQDQVGYKNMVMTDLQDLTGYKTDWKIYQDVNDSDIMYLEAPNDITDKKTLRIPKEIARIINSNPDFWSGILKSDTNKRRFAASLSNWIKSSVGEGVALRREITQEDLVGIGFDESTATTLENLLNNVYGDRNGKNRAERRKMHVVQSRIHPTSTPQVEPIEMHQEGGKYKKTVSTEGRVYKTDSVYRKPEEVAGESNDWELTAADGWQLASLIADGSALVATLSQVGKPVAPFLGIAGTGSQLVADIKRDGFDWGDAGNFAMGLGLDVLSLLPGAGDAGMAGKFVKNLGKVAHVVKPILYGLGLKSAVTGLENILHGEGTLDDYRGLLNGLTAIRGGIDDAKLMRNTKYKGKTQVASKKTDEEIHAEAFESYMSNAKNKSAINAKIDEVSSSDITARNKALDEFVKNNPQYTKHTDTNGNQVNNDSWFDVDGNKIITDRYDEAYSGLKNIPDFQSKFYAELKKVSPELATKLYKSVTGFDGFKEYLTTWKSKAGNAFVSTRNFFNGSYNPFSSNYKYRPENRTFDDVDIDKINPRTLRFLANSHSNLRTELDARGYDVNLKPIFGNWSTVARVTKRSNDPSTTSGGSRIESEPTRIVETPQQEYVQGRLFKKGGKIIKGQSGLSGILPNPMNNFKSYFAGSPEKYDATYTNNNIHQSGVLDGINTSKMSSFDSRLGRATNYSDADASKKQEIINNDLHQNLLNSTSKPTFQGVPGATKGNDILSKASDYLNNNKGDIFNGIQYYLAQKATKKQKELANKRADSLEKMKNPYNKQITIPNYNENDIAFAKEKNDNIINNYNYASKNHSDPGMQRLSNAQTLQAKLDSNNNYNSERSKRITDYQNKQFQASVLNDERVSQKIQFDNQKKLGVDDARISADMISNAASFKNKEHLNYYLYDKWDRQQALRDQITGNINQVKNNEKLYRELVNKYQDRFNALSDDEKAAYNNNVLEYAYAVDPITISALQTQNTLNAMASTYNERYPFDRIQSYTANLSLIPESSEYSPIVYYGMPFDKKGGKIYRVEDKLFLDNSKAVRMSISKLEDHIMKIILKLLS